MPNESTAIAVTARGLGDYRQMFALDDARLAECHFLDCASGASAFAAELRAHGGQVISSDPLYSAGLTAVRQRALHNLNHCEHWLDAHKEVIDWDYLGSATAYRQNGLRALELFSEDFATHSDCYLAASLPRIPLSDDAVGVSLCANFLFAYADTMDLDFHTAAIIELARVARSVVLIHPLSHAMAATSMISQLPSGAASPQRDCRRRPSLRRAHGFVVHQRCESPLDTVIESRT